MSKKQAFTLIELLVVIAIIAILAAILFPVFARARAKARQTSCLSNIKQLCMGMNMYAQDYDEVYPVWHWGASYSGGDGWDGSYPDNVTSAWWNAIYPYVKNAKVYECPDNKIQATSRQDGMGWFDPARLANPAISHIEPALLDVTIGYGTIEPLTEGQYPKIAMLQRNSETLLVSDMIALTSGWDYWDCYDPTWNKPCNNYRLRRVAYANGVTGSDYCPWGGNDCNTGPFNGAWDASARHNNGNNIGFADGHAKWLTAGRTTLFLFGWPQ